MTAAAPILDGATTVDPAFVPQTPDELVRCLASWEWRIFSGQLYKIIVKDDDDPDDPGVVKPFIPNQMQRDFLARLWYRNLTLKARQLGSTTLVSILWLDHALFNAHQRCGIIAQTMPLAQRILSDKIRFAWQHLPDGVRDRMPLERDNETEIAFAHNGSSVVVGTSFRSGTMHRLLVSEMGKIAVESPRKAHEIVTGSLPTVPASGIACIESTADGQDGEFYKLARRAEERAELRTPLAPAEWRFHFFPWWHAPDYEADPHGVAISPGDGKYFSKVEAYVRDHMPAQWLRLGRRLSPSKRAWYVLKRDQDFGGDQEKMWTEYPSIPEESWMRSTEGAFFSRQLASARIEGRIGFVPHMPSLPVHTFWDIGAGDGTGIWCGQAVGAGFNWLRYVEGWDEGYETYVRALRETGWIFGGHFLPHDANHVRQHVTSVGKPIEALQSLAPDWSFHIVPRVDTLEHGIQMLRQSFPTYRFDEQGCKDGLIHLAEYRKSWNARIGAWKPTPPTDSPHREAADSLRQHAQGWDPAIVNPGGFMSSRRRHRRRAGSMTA